MRFKNHRLQTPGLVWLIDLLSDWGLCKFESMTLTVVWNIGSTTVTYIDKSMALSEVLKQQTINICACYSFTVNWMYLCATREHELIQCYGSWDAANVPGNFQLTGYLTHVNIVWSRKWSQEISNNRLHHEPTATNFFHYRLKSAEGPWTENSKLWPTRVNCWLNFICYPFSTKAGVGLIQSQCLQWNEFFLKIWPRKLVSGWQHHSTGLEWRTAYIRSWGRGYHDPQDQPKLYDHHFLKTQLVSCL